MQTFEIKCDDLKVTEELIAALLRQYFETMKYPMTKVTVKEI